MLLDRDLSHHAPAPFARSQSGTYIKEFVHGDGGRTAPSVAAALGRECEVLWLDVVAIEDFACEAAGASSSKRRKIARASEVDE